MNDMTDLNFKSCDGSTSVLTHEDIEQFRKSLHGDWRLNTEHNTLTREFSFKGFAKATYTANLAAFIGDKQGHHPDIAFGWGYCRIVFSTHEVSGLTQNDFICAAKLDQVVA